MEKPSNGLATKRIGQAETTRMITKQFVDTVIWAFLLVLFVCSLVFFLQVHFFKKSKLQDIVEASRVHTESIAGELSFYERSLLMLQANIDSRQIAKKYMVAPPAPRDDDQLASRVVLINEPAGITAEEKNRSLMVLNAFAFSTSGLYKLDEGIVQSYLALENGLLAAASPDVKNDTAELKSFMNNCVKQIKSAEGYRAHNVWIGVHSVSSDRPEYIMVAVPLYVDTKFVGITACDIEIPGLFKHGRLSSVFNGQVLMVSSDTRRVMANSLVAGEVMRQEQYLENILPKVLELQDQGILLQPDGKPVFYAGYTVISRSIEDTSIKLLYIVGNKNLLESAMEGLVYYLLILLLVVVVVIVMIRMIVQSMVKPAIALVEHISLGSSEVNDNSIVNIPLAWRPLFFQTAKSFSVQSIADKMPGAIISFETRDIVQSNVLFVSSGITEHFGIDSEEMKNRNLSEYIKNTYHLQLKNAMEEAVENKSNLFFDMEISDGKGSWHWARLIVTPQLQGDVVLWDGVLLNISEQKHAEKLFSAVFESHNAIMLLLDVGSMRVIDANNSARNFYGERLLGASASRLIDISQGTKLEELLQQASGGSTIFAGIAVNQHGEKRNIQSDIAIIEQDMKKIAFIITYDVTEKMILEAALQNARHEAEKNLELILALFAAIPNPVLFLNKDGLVTGCNRSYERFFGKSASEIVGAEPDIDINLPKLDEDNACTVSEDFIDGVIVYECRIKNAWQQERYFEIHSSITRDKNNQPSGSVIVMVDITERKHREMELRLRATTDMLTGVYNRAYFMELAEAEVTRAHRYSLPMSIIFIDIDYFKRINDEYGHFAGDSVLSEIASLCEDTLREADFIGRLGGEEFAACLVQCAINDAYTVAERIRKLVEERQFHAGPHKMSVTLSVGVAQLRENEGLENVINRSDAALYEAKKMGRNKVIADDTAKS